MVFFFLSSAYAECDDPHSGEKHCLESVDFVVSANGPPYASSGIDLLSRLAVTDFPGGATAATDIWGYVSPSGREYALLGLNTGTAFVEITDPTTPVIVEVIPHAGGSCCSDVKTFGAYAYSVTEGGGGAQVIDMTAIDTGTVFLVNTFNFLGLNQAHNIAINEDSGFAYVCGAFNSGTVTGGLFVLNLADPVNPVFAGGWSDAYVHDVQVVTYTEGPNAGREIAFASSGTSGFGVPMLRIIDVTNKSNMQIIGTTVYPNALFTHQAWLSEDKNTLYLNDEFDEQAVGVPTSTMVIDVRDLTNPQYVSTISTGLPSTDHNLMVVGDFLYEANYTSGLRVLSLEDLFFGQELGFFDTFPASDAAGFAGAWGVYAKFPSGTVIVSDIQSGLFVLDVSALTANRPAVPVGGGWTSLALAGLLLLAAVPLLHARLKG